MFRDKRNVYSLIIILLMIIFFTVTYLKDGTVVDTGSLFVTRTEIIGDKLFIYGSTANSGQAFAAYSYITKDNNIYVKLKYSIVNPFNKYGDFIIVINEHLTSINNVYLQGNRADDLKLVWTKGTE